MDSIVYSLIGASRSEPHTYDIDIIYDVTCICRPYIPVFYFSDMQYFFHYAHAHTISQAREWSEYFNVELEKEGKLCDIEQLKRKKD